MKSDQQLARIAGLFYLIVIATGLFSEVFVLQALRVPGDAAAQHIRAHEHLFRWGLVADLINFVADLPSVLIMYLFFRRVNKFVLKLALSV